MIKLLTNEGYRGVKIEIILNGNLKNIFGGKKKKKKFLLRDFHSAVEQDDVQKWS